MPKGWRPFTPRTGRSVADWIDLVGGVGLIIVALGYAAWSALTGATP